MPRDASTSDSRLLDPLPHPALVGALDVVGQRAVDMGVPDGGRGRMTDADLILVALFAAWRDDIETTPFPEWTVQKGQPAK